MENDCNLVVFSDKAYNAIIRETFEWDPVETGGILLGHILDNGCWIVMEVLPPGYSEGREGNNVHHEMGYFEYNQRFVNYLANSVATQYKIPLNLLGLWHRHPGGMDVFSTTDDGTNRTFASLNPHGAISGLVNVDPKLRMTMYHIRHDDVGFARPNYEKVGVEVGSDLIPEEYFAMQYYGGDEDDLHPSAPSRNRQREDHPRRQTVSGADKREAEENNTNRPSLKDQLGHDVGNNQNDENNPLGHQKKNLLLQLVELYEKLRKNKLAVALFGVLIVVVFCCSFAMFWNGVANFAETLDYTIRHSEIEVSDPITCEPEMTLTDLTPKVVKTNPQVDDIVWTSDNPNVVKVDKNGAIIAVANGEALVTATCGGQHLQCHVVVSLPQEEPLKVTIDSEELNLGVSESQELTLKCNDKNFDLEKLEWKIDNEDVATVSGEGVFFAKNPGLTIAYLCLGNDTLNSIKITVNNR